jgi:hypothetical protein
VIRGRGELDPEWHDRMIEFIEPPAELLNTPGALLSRSHMRDLEA